MLVPGVLVPVAVPGVPVLVPGVPVPVALVPVLSVPGPPAETP